ncbi:MAG: UPF0164 family protein [Candidatus Krumholzibacteriota bacterium]|nr:UPF0164 family protein [Candidatus Krumholzibacteriota bacterium]
MNKGKIVIFTVIMLFSAISSRSQIIGTMQADRLDLLNTYQSGGRAASLGGAYTAVSNDAFALIYNPAGLTQINKKELSFGIYYSTEDLSTNYDRYNSLLPNSSTGISHLTTVYPFPTYRGSFVIGFGVFRVANSDLEYFKNSRRDDLNGTIRNTLIQTGNIYQYRFGAGVDISPRIAAGANLVVWDGSSGFVEDISFEHTASDSSYLFSDDVSVNLDGLSMEMGLLFRLSKTLRAGLKISTPAWLSYDGDAVEYYDWSYSNGAEWTTDPYYYYIEDEYTLPMKLRGGVSYQFKNLLLCADAEYCDYTQTKYNGKKLYNKINRNDPVLEKTLDLSFGAEFALPFYPAKLRAGYSYIPTRFIGMEELSYIEETSETMSIISEWSAFDVIKNRQLYSFGIGGLIDKVLKLDLTVSIGSFERETEYLTETVDITKTSLSTSYRF